VTLNGQRGKVVRVGLFRTQLATTDLDIISVKNSTVLGEDIINHSGLKLRRLILLVRVANYGTYGLDINAFKADALSVITEVQNKLCPEALKEHGKDPEMWLVEFGEASDHFNAMFFNKETGAEKALDEINVALATAFRQKGVVFGDASDD
jgi:small-conductance mechanosensitive channel